MRRGHAAALAVFEAARDGDAEALRALLADGAPINHTDDVSLQPYCLALTTARMTAP